MSRELERKIKGRATRGSEITGRWPIPGWVRKRALGSRLRTLLKRALRRELDD